MPKDERRRQKSLARKAQKHKKRAAAHQRADAAPSVRAAAHWPLYECLVSRSWSEPGELVQILVARSSGGEIAVAGFLVDLGCLGVKDALSDVLTSREYEQFRHTYTSLQPMVRADLDLAAKIIQEGIAYAKCLGFNPHPDYRKAAVLLGGADPAACATDIPLGIDGQPIFIQGPHDNPSRILRQLDRSVGPGNYQYVLAVGGDEYVAAEIDAGDEDLDVLEDIDYTVDEPEETSYGAAATEDTGSAGQEPETGSSFLQGLFHRRRPQ